jgi:hypothetical protein
MKTEVVASINKHSNTLRSKYKALRSKTQMQNEYKMVLEANTSTKSTSEAIQIQKSRGRRPYFSILGLCEHPEHCG